MTARDAALSALRVFRLGGDYRAELESRLSDVADARERALANTITLGVVRNLTLCDYYISSASSIKLGKIEPQALDILRAAVYQLAFLDKIPASAAVNEAVKRARQKLNPRAAGFINAVLRKLSSEALPEVKAAGEIERLAVLYSHPEWLVREFVSRLGEAETEELLRANNAEPPIYARVNTLKTTQPELADTLTRLGVEVQNSSLDGTLELRGTGNITALEPFIKGEFFVQDPSSTRCALTVGAKSGERIIDACAAPGGKSFALSLEMQNAGEILAFDTDAKLDMINDGARRLGINIISARAGDSSVFDASLENTADAVLVDAPCSGFGVVRKKPEIRYKSEAEIAELPETALAILQNCARYVKPGGRLIYSTCTLLERENEGVVRAFLDGGDSFALRNETMLYPHRDGFDGFFIAVMERNDA